MISTLYFLVVNSLLAFMLLTTIKKRGSIGIDFALCLLFTFLGNASLGAGINTLVSLFNVYLGLYLVKNKQSDTT